MASLVGCPHDMLLQSCLGWWYQMHIVLICEKFLSGFVDVCACACSVIEQDNEPIYCCVTYSGISLGAEDNCNSASVNSGNTFQIAKADFLPCPAKLEMVLHPVMHGTLAMPAPSVIQGQMLICGLLHIGNTCQFQMLTRVLLLLEKL